MTDKEAIEMMQRCREEIMSLRRRIEWLEPRAEAYASIAAVLHLLPQPSRGYGEDVVWTLEKRIHELEAKPNEAAK